MTGQAYDEQIWVDEARKLAGIRRDVAAGLGAGLNVLIVAHFENMLSVIARRLRAEGFEARTYAGDASALCATGQRPAFVWITLASHLGTGAFASGGKTEEITLRVLAAEHHPLPAPDEALLAALSSLPCRSSVTFHVALTDALLARFVGESALALLKKLGHAEDESLSHPLITKAIRGAQEKVAKQARGALPTLSAEEWFQHNMERRDGL